MWNLKNKTYEHAKQTHSEMQGTNWWPLDGRAWGMGKSGHWTDPGDDSPSYRHV